MESVNFQDFIFRFFCRIVRKMVPAYMIAFASLAGVCIFYPPFLILPAILMGIIIISILFSREVIEFTHAFYVSGHWKKYNQDYLKIRLYGDRTIPNFKRLKILAWLFILIPALFYLLAIFMLLIRSAEENWFLGQLIIYGFVALFMIFIHAFIGYWSLRGAKFVTKYQPF